MSIHDIELPPSTVAPGLPESSDVLDLPELLAQCDQLKQKIDNLKLAIAARIPAESARLNAMLQTEIDRQEATAGESK